MYHKAQRLAHNVKASPSPAHRLLLATSIRLRRGKHRQAATRAYLFPICHRCLHTSGAGLSLTRFVEKEAQTRKAAQ